MSCWLTKATTDVCLDLTSDSSGLRCYDRGQECSAGWLRAARYRHFCRVYGAFIIIAALVISVVPLAWATPKLEEEIDDIEKQARALSDRFFSGIDEQLAERRLVDAQLLYRLKDYDRAAMLLLDYIKKYPKNHGYLDALYYLADSLFLKREFFSAKRYFQQLLSWPNAGRYRKRALARMVELSLHLDEPVAVKAHFDLLANTSSRKVQAGVLYAVGKYHFFAKRINRALSVFSKIRPKQKYYAQAQYFVGACFVKKKKYSTALKLFSALAKVPASDEVSRHVRDLAFLATGRLYYQAEKFAQAIDTYLRISRFSKEYDVALYESAWAYIRSGEMLEALRALDLLALAKPDSPITPEVRVLQGNLLIRLEHLARATDLFVKARDKFTPIYSKMKRLIAEKRDPNIFFDALLARNVQSGGTLAIQADMPEIAIAWVKERPQVKRAIYLVGDVRAIRQSIEKSKKLIAHLHNIVNSHVKRRILADYSVAAEQAEEVENRLTRVRHRILEEEHRLLEKIANKEERQRLRSLKNKRGSLEALVFNLPQSQPELHTRTLKKVKRVEGLEHRLSKLEVVIRKLSTQLVGARKYFAANAATINKRTRRVFIRESQAIYARLNQHDNELSKLKFRLKSLHYTAKVGDAENAAEREAVKQYAEHANREHALLVLLHSRLSSSAAGKFDELKWLMDRCKKIGEVLFDFNAGIEKETERQLAEIRTAIAEERDHIVSQANEASAYEAKTNTLAGDVVHSNFKTVAERFYEIVVRSHIGMADIAWTLKEIKRKKIIALARQRKREIHLLDEEIKKIIPEDIE